MSAAAHRSLALRRLAAVALLCCAGCTQPRSAPDSQARAASAPSAVAADAVNAVASPSTPASTASSSRRLTIVTGDERETDFQIGRDLARWVAPAAGLSLEVRASRGAADNVHRLHDRPDVDLAIVQYDVLQAFIQAAAKGSKDAAALVKPIRVVAPLYTQELYFIVRRDSPMKSVDQIRGKRINVGLVGSGSALTVATVYQKMFRAPLATANTTYLDEQRALLALTADRSIDVVVLIAGQPARVLAEMKPAAREYIRLLTVDPSRPSSKAAFAWYFPATIEAANYPAWLDQDVPSLSVMSFLVTRTDRAPGFTEELDDFARSLCQNIGSLKRQGHPKWLETDVTLKLGTGWTYSPASIKELTRCPAADSAKRD